MRIDSETGNITHVDYESYIEMKEDYENKVEQLKQELEDKDDIIAELEEELEELKKDSIVAATESK